MLEPWTDKGAVENGDEAVVIGDFTDEEDITIDVHEGNFLSVWCPPASKIISK